MVVRNIQSLARSFSNVVFSFVRRNANRIAHKLVRISDQCSEMRAWLEDYPPEISSDLLFDISRMS